MSITKPTTVKAYTRSDGTKVKEHASTRNAAEPRYDVATAAAAGPMAHSASMEPANFGLPAELESHLHLVQDDFEGQTFDRSANREYGVENGGVTFGLAYDLRTGRLYAEQRESWHEPRSTYEQENVLLHEFDTYVPAESQEEYAEQVAEELGAYRALIQEEESQGIFRESHDFEFPEDEGAEVGQTAAAMEAWEQDSEANRLILGSALSAPEGIYFDHNDFSAEDTEFEIHEDGGETASFEANPYNEREFRAAFDEAVEELQQTIAERDGDEA